MGRPPRIRDPAGDSEDFSRPGRTCQWTRTPLICHRNSRGMGRTDTGPADPVTVTCPSTVPVKPEHWHAAAAAIMPVMIGTYHQ